MTICLCYSTSHVMCLTQTFKVDKSEVLSAEILHHLHTVHHDGSTEDVGQSKDMDLLERLAFLVGQCQHSCPVLPQLVLSQTVALQVGLSLLLLLPPLVEPAARDIHREMYASMYNVA